MIKRQYQLTGYNGYFDNFMQSLKNNSDLASQLMPYQATIAKSKSRKINVKWHDEKLYTLFVLRWS